MAATGTLPDPVSGAKHQQNTNWKVSNFNTTIVGQILYEGGHPHCKEIQTSWNGHKIVSLWDTKDLEVII